MYHNDQDVVGGGFCACGSASLLTTMESGLVVVDVLLATTEVTLTLGLLISLLTAETTLTLGLVMEEVLRVPLRPIHSLLRSTSMPWLSWQREL